MTFYLSPDIDQFATVHNIYVVSEQLSYSCPINNYPLYKTIIIGSNEPFFIPLSINNISIHTIILHDATIEFINIKISPEICYISNCTNKYGTLYHTPYNFLKKYINDMIADINNFFKI